MLLFHHINYLEFLHPKHQAHYKCVESNLKQPKFAVFVDKNKDGGNVDIEYSHDGQDSLGDFPSGHVKTEGGDSGGSFWSYYSSTIYYSTIVPQKQKRSVAVAILSDGYENVFFSTKKKYFCRIGATKITNDMLKWIKEISGLR